MEPGVTLAVEERNGRIQALHTGHAIRRDASGKVTAWGDPATTTYWRSSAKPLQAVPFATVFRDLGLGGEELALACGSHSGEPLHVATARRILAAARLTEADLQCGTHDPGPAAGAPPPGGWGPIHNNCSGKHAAMLATCVHRGWPTKNYLDPAHPLQGAIRDVVEKAAGAPAPYGVDGCGLPTFYLGVDHLARSFQWLSNDPTGKTILSAMGSHPFMVAGTNGSDTDLGLHALGRVVSKYGALGVVGAIHRDSGAAIAVKLVAGTALPAKAVALALMRDAGWLSPAAATALEGHIEPVLRNHAGVAVGKIRTLTSGAAHPR
ncbi:MAG: asparaginase [Thermoplasmatota archaeon]